MFVNVIGMIYICIKEEKEAKNADDLVKFMTNFTDCKLHNGLWYSP